MSIGVTGSGTLPVDLCPGPEAILGLAPAVKVMVPGMRTVAAGTRVEIFDAECDDWFEHEVQAVCEYGYRSAFMGPAIKTFDDVAYIPPFAFFKCKALVDTLARRALWETTTPRFRLVFHLREFGVKEPQIAMVNIQFHAGKDAMFVLPIGDYAKHLACLRWTVDWRRVAFGAYVRAVGRRATVSVSGGGWRIELEKSIEEIAKDIGKWVQRTAGCWYDFLIDW